MASEQQIKMIRRVVKQDIRYKRLLKVFNNNPLYDINIDVLHDEIGILHKSRTLRTLKTSTSGFGDKVVSACIQDQACRSRIVEILAESMRVRVTLHRLITSYRDYVIIEHSEKLRTISTKQERVMFIDTILRKFIEFTEDLDSLNDHCNVIVKDIDQAGYAIKNIIAAMTLINKPEHTL